MKWVACLLISASQSTEQQICELFVVRFDKQPSTASLYIARTQSSLAGSPKFNSISRVCVWPQVTRTFDNSLSDVKPRPYTVFARESDHCPNFWEVLVNVMVGVMVLFTMACKTRWQRTFVKQLIIMCSLAE